MSSSLCPPRYNESDPDFVALWGDKKRHMEAPGRVCTQYIPGYLPSSALFLLLRGLLRGGEEGRVVRNPLLQSDSVPALHPSLCYAASSLYSGKPRSRLKGGGFGYVLQGGEQNFLIGILSFDFRGAEFSFPSGLISEYLGNFSN